MQDQNLSGMSWIKVGDSRFRSPVLKTVKDRGGKGSVGSATPRDPCKEDDFVLIQDKIPSDLCWENKVDKALSIHSETMDEETLEQFLAFMGSEFWTRKETSCDLELDTTGAYWYFY